MLIFGPGQSGPGVRAVYLKQKHGLKLRTHVCYALVLRRLCCLERPVAAGVQRAVLAPGHPGFFGVIGVVWLVLRRLKKWPQARLHVTPRLLTMLTLAVAAQMACYVLIYFVELQMVQAGANLRQVVAYAGAANFSLFVSLTPGGIGIRKRFGVFYQAARHWPTSIVAANVIDRAVYVVVLGFVVCGPQWTACKASIYVIIPLMVTKRRSGITALSLGALGVVFGDIGTSPFYARRQSLAWGRQIACDARKHSGATIAINLDHNACGLCKIHWPHYVRRQQGRGRHSGASGATKVPWQVEGLGHLDVGGHCGRVAILWR